MKSRIASRTSWTLPHNAAVPVGRMTTLVMRSSTFALRSASTRERTVGWRFEELADDAAGLHLLEVAAHPQDERRIALDPRLAPDEQRGDHQAGHRDGDRGGDENEDEDHTAPDSHTDLPWPDLSV